MVRPSTDQVTVATRTLRTEADSWDQESVAASTLARQAEELRLNRVEAGPFQLVVDAYGEVVDQVVARLGEGAGRMADIAATLRRVADVYDREEADNVHQLSGLH